MKRLLAALALVVVLVAPARAGLYETPSQAGMSWTYTWSSGANAPATSGGVYLACNGWNDAGAGGTSQDRLDRQCLIQQPALFTGMACGVDTAPGSGVTRSFGVNINESNVSAISACNITGASATSCASSFTAVLQQGDRFEPRQDVTGGTAASSHARCTYFLQGLGGTNPVPQFILADSGSTAFTGGSTTQYLAFSGQFQTPQSTNTDIYGNIPIPGVLRNAWCSLGNALSSTQTYTITLQTGGGADTAITIPITSSTTPSGQCAVVGYGNAQCGADSTHTVAVGAGYQVGGWKVVPANSAPATVVHCGIEFDPAGGVSPTIPVYTKSADYTITAADLAQAQSAMFICSTASARTLTLPAANAAPGKTIRIKREGANTCTASRAGSDTLYDGSSVNTRDLTLDGEVIELTSDGVSSWAVH